MLNLKEIDSSWTLFIDRDGVINHEKHLGYILHWQEFVFYEGVPKAMNILDDFFDVIVMVTNQKGIGKGLMSVQDLDAIHNNMIETVETAGGRIDRIYYCSDLDNNSPNRKPNAGMAFQAKKDFPSIDFAKSIMVGNKLSDMGFGRNAGMHTVFVATTNPETPYPHSDIDLRFNNLLHFAETLASLKKA